MPSPYEINKIRDESEKAGQGERKEDEREFRSAQRHMGQPRESAKLSHVCTLRMGESEGDSLGRSSRVGAAAEDCAVVTSRK